MTKVAHIGTVIGSQPVLNLIDGTNVTLTIANNNTTDSIDVTVGTALSILATGIVLNTTSTGVLSVLANSSGSNGEVLTLSGGVPIWAAGGGLPFTLSASSLRNIGMGTNITGTAATDTICIGNQSGQSLNNLSAVNNIFIGPAAGGSMQSGYHNICLGGSALGINEVGFDNVSIGNASLSNATNTNTTQMVAVGSNAGSLLWDSSSNSTFVGFNSGAVGNGILTQISYQNCTFLGAATDSTIATLINSSAIGYNTKVSANNSVNIGTGVNVGLNLAVPLSVLHINPGPTSTLADLRFTNSTTAPLSPAAGSGTLYVQSSTGTNADQVMFQPGVGSTIQLIGSTSGTAPANTWTGVCPVNNSSIYYTLIGNIVTLTIVGFQLGAISANTLNLANPLPLFLCPAATFNQYMIFPVTLIDNTNGVPGVIYLSTRSHLIPGTLVMGLGINPTTPTITPYTGLGDAGFFSISITYPVS